MNSLSAGGIFINTVQSRAVPLACFLSALIGLGDVPARADWNRSKRTTAKGFGKQRDLDNLGHIQR